MKRPATHAFSWYEGDPQILNRQLEEFLLGADVEKSDARAIIAPHAGYRFSGQTAAYAYKAISPQNIERVFLLGPSHKVYLKGCALSVSEYYETPIGDIKVDLGGKSKLTSYSKPAGYWKVLYDECQCG